jgi:hypothetical protein
MGENCWKRNEYCDDGLKENRARRKIGKFFKKRKRNQFFQLSTNVIQWILFEKIGAPPGPAVLIRGNLILPSYHPFGNQRPKQPVQSASE